MFSEKKKKEKRGGKGQKTWADDHLKGQVVWPRSKGKGSQLKANGGGKTAAL